MIYFAKSNNGLIKIGTVAHVDSHLRKISAAYGEHYTLLATMPGNRQTLRALQQRFATLRAGPITASRFRLGPDLVDVIEAARSSGSAPTADRIAAGLGGEPSVSAH
jgi:hypothetical protein